MIILLDQFGLVVEHGKTEVFHFSRLMEHLTPWLSVMGRFGHEQFLFSFSFIF